MCLLFFETREDAKPNEYSLILVNVRDEFYDRPTKLAAKWNDSQIFGAQDNEKGREGGTWIAINRETAKIGVVLNILQPQCELCSQKIARGHLVVDFLKGHFTPNEYMNKICENGKEYNGFLLVAMQLNANNSFDVSYFSNMYHTNPQTLSPGVHAFGNSMNPEKPWNKVSYGKSKFQEIVNKHSTIDTKDELLKDIFKMLGDKQSHQLDDTIKAQGMGKPEKYLEKLNSLLVEIPSCRYGTRTWTVIIIDGNKNVDYIERTMQEPIICDDHSVHANWVLNEHHFTLN